MSGWKGQGILVKGMRVNRVGVVLGERSDTMDIRRNFCLLFCEGEFWPSTW
jgi:hypothetical protein